jgi:replicative DNA helicase
MHRRHLQIVSGREKNEVNKRYEEIYNQNKDKLEHIMVQTISPSLDKIAEKVRELQPSLLIVDYIDLVDTPMSYRGEYEKIKYISHGLSNMAVNNDMIVIQISQVSREYSRNEVLDLYAGKGSGAIENASRKVIGLNGQSNSKTRAVRLFKNTDGELFDTEVEWTPSFRLRRLNETVN